VSLDSLDAQVDTLRQEAATSSANFAREAKTITSNSNLSDEGKAAAKAEVNKQAKDHLRSLSRKETEAINMKVRDLERQLDAKAGSTASDIIAFRDAQDRAERFDQSEDAVKALERALRTEDNVLAHAIFRRGMEANWRDVLATFGNAYPEKKSIVSELTYLREAQRNTLARGMSYMWVNQ